MGDHWEFVERFVWPLDCGRGVCIFCVSSLFADCVEVGYSDCGRVFVFVTCCSMFCFIDYIGCFLWVVFVFVVTIEKGFTVLEPE